MNKFNSPPRLSQFLHVNNTKKALPYDENGIDHKKYCLKDLIAFLHSFIFFCRRFPHIIICFGIFSLSEPLFKRFHHIWKRSKKSQTPQQTQKVCESIYYCFATPFVSYVLIQIVRLTLPVFWMEKSQSNFLA